MFQLRSLTVFVTIQSTENSNQFGSNLYKMRYQLNILVILTLLSTKAAENLSNNENIHLTTLMAKSTNPDVLRLKVSKVSPDDKHDMLTLDQTERSISLAVFAMNMFVGLIYRLLLARNAWKNGFFSRPINLLTGHFESTFFG